MKRKHYRIFAAVLLCIALLTVSAGADTGPKPRIGIQVQNAPRETHYLDLSFQTRKQATCSTTFRGTAWNAVLWTRTSWTSLKKPRRARTTA